MRSGEGGVLMRGVFMKIHAAMRGSGWGWEHRSDGRKCEVIRWVGLYLDITGSSIVKLAGTCSWQNNDVLESAGAVACFTDYITFSR